MDKAPFTEKKEIREAALQATPRTLGNGRGEPKQPYPAKTETPDKYTSYHLYVSDDLINEIVTIGKETLKELMLYKK